MKAEEQDVALMLAERFRLYSPEECGSDGYPRTWHDQEHIEFDDGSGVILLPVKVVVRHQAGYRCERCGHPYKAGDLDTVGPRGEWSLCDDRCTHDGPLAHERDLNQGSVFVDRLWAQWRILTVHHLNGVKWDLRWWNLVALCQRCHLQIQGKVRMEQVYPLEHSDWFKPYAAAYYASTYLGEDLTREETVARLDELLALERRA